jgi:hypothetical protein
MSNLNEEDIAEYLEEKVYSKDFTIVDLVCEWEDLIEELTEKEIDYYYNKRTYNALADKIIAETDFKSLYKANNQKIRDNHVKKELATLYGTIKDLEFSIDYLNRRISFLRELVKCKRVMLQNKGD